MLGARHTVGKILNADKQPPGWPEGCVSPKKQGNEMVKEHSRHQEGHTMKESQRGVRPGEKSEKKKPTAASKDTTKQGREKEQT